ncbi:Hypothetical protein FKW44_008066 [Caligus rogercresseyi]|uniref:Uncharacterized protein n=1 Tax=Caligus rogercresseyi TaxID=217165 RepID=A0A7T8KFS2_CALRO|nr:Hypothetical protein FKW44_008066 [Caligus rogercresseyi]
MKGFSSRREFCTSSHPSRRLKFPDNYDSSYLGQQWPSRYRGAEPADDSDSFPDILNNYFVVGPCQVPANSSPEGQV